METALSKKAAHCLLLQTYFTKIADGVGLDQGIE